MTNRTTQKDLQAVVDRINRITNSPLIPWKRENNRNVAQIGNYHLDGAYGGYDLHRMQNEGGGCESLFHGHYSKRELYNRMQSFIKGLEVSIEGVK